MAAPLCWPQCVKDVYVTGKGRMCEHFKGLVQNCSISSANTMEILQSCTKPQIYSMGYTAHKSVADNACQMQGNILLTYWGLVMPYGVGDLGQHWFR